MGTRNGGGTCNLRQGLEDIDVGEPGAGLLGVGLFKKRRRATSISGGETEAPLRHKVGVIEVFLGRNQETWGSVKRLHRHKKGKGKQPGEADRGSYRGESYRRVLANSRK